MKETFIYSITATEVIPLPTLTLGFLRQEVQNTSVFLLLVLFEIYHIQDTSNKGKCTNY
ncbi:MAG: hypothetical protein ACJAWW_002062 [Sulfurimonas sp.]|jgi:hypothetical protein